MNINRLVTIILSAMISIASAITYGYIVWLSIPTRGGGVDRISFSSVYFGIFITGLMISILMYAIYTIFSSVLRQTGRQADF